MKDLIYGGGKKQKSPTVLDDNLLSDERAEVLIGLCEGEIEGPVDGEKSIYLDDTPLMSVDGSRNFSDYSLEVYNGSPEQTIHFNQGGSGRTNSVGVEVLNETPIVRLTQSGDIDAIDVKLAVQRLYYSDSSGNVFNATVYFKIGYKLTTETEWNEKELSITGKTTTGYTKDYRIPVSRSTESRYEVRVTKVSPDSPTGQYGFFNSLIFSSFEEITARDLVFNNTAGIKLDIKTSDELRSLPTISGEYKLLKIKIPSNYNPNTRVYTGDWDGTFKIAWTDNPAWCLYDLIMNDRYGVNAYYPVEADKWDFYEAAQYCDELVPDGKGGYEPRYTLNMIITDAQSGPDMLNYIAGTFNSTIYEDGSGLVRLSFEHNQTPVHLFGLENVTPAGFVYSFTDPESRFNDYTVTFTNSEQNWIEDRRRVADYDNISEFGRVTKNFAAVGCIKESEALRRARYQLIGGLTETMSVTFTTTIAAYNVNPFDIILVSDPNMGYATSGRLREIAEDGMSATLRDSIYLEAGVNYTVQLQTPSGVREVTLDVREVGYVKTLYFTDSVLNLDLPEFCMFVLEGNNGEDTKGSPKPFRVLAISESSSGEGISITAVEVNRNKQREADEGIELPDAEYSRIPSYELIPQIVSASFTEGYNIDTKQCQLFVEVKVDPNYRYYSDKIRVWSRLVGEETWEEREVQLGNVIIDHPVGNYEFRILPVTTLGTVPPFDLAPIFEYTVEGTTVPPATVQNFRAEPTVNNINFYWDAVQDSDLIGYQIRKGSSWDNGEIIAEFVTGTSFTYTTSETQNATYMIKAIDAVQNFSLAVAQITTSLKRPKNIKQFYVTPNQDTLRFDWVADLENGVEYEVRIGGPQWDYGIKLFKVTGFNQTVLNPAYSDNGFMIRAVSQAGLYSESYMYAEVRCELKQDRNIILTLDNANDQNWAGVTNGLVVDPTLNTLNMKSESFYGEHYFDVHLPAVVRARNWYETEGFRFGAALTFEDLDYAWGSEEASKQRWLNSEGVSTITGAEIQPVISYELQTTYDHDLGFRFNDTLLDTTNTVSPDSTLNITYSPAKYSNGLDTHIAMKAEYDNLNITGEFTLKFKVKTKRHWSDEIYIFKLEGSGGTISFSIKNKNTLQIERSDGVVASAPVSFFEEFDFLYICVVQSTTKLKVYYLTEYAENDNNIEVDCAPLGALDKLSIGGYK